MLIDPPQLTICEPRPRLTPEMQRQFLHADVRIRSCTSLRDLPSLLKPSVRCVLMLDFDADAAGCLQFLGRNHGAKSLPVICVGSSDSAELEWLARELGALDFVIGPVSGELLANLCRKLWTSDGRP